VRIARLDAGGAQRIGEIVMTLSSLSSTQRAAPQVSFDTDRVRTLIAEYLGVDAKRVTDEAHFSDDLGLDWLDRLELMILIEDEFPDVGISDHDTNQIEVVGDLIRVLKS
jgi:acyl carrier protein